jgi:hypothetical protein
VSCTKDTRMEILSRVYGWFDGKNLEIDETLPMKGNAKGQIFWLDGMAGTGKSTISQTISNHFHERNELGASFFCSRDNDECSDINLIFPTIAYQLSSFNSTFKKYVSEAMREDPDVQSALSSRQLLKLIVEPLEAAVGQETFPPCIIVIDALDECKEANVISTLFRALLEYANRLSLLGVKFFITSQPVPNVVHGFCNAGLMNDTSTLALHSIPSDTSGGDIRVYLEEKFLDIAKLFSLPSSWPSKDDFNRLVEQSRGLVIFAATAAKFIGDGATSNPKVNSRVSCPWSTLS